LFAAKQAAKFIVLLRMAKILITGGSGLLGHRLTQLLLERGDRVVHLGRKENLKSAVPCFRWDPNAGVLDAAAFDGVDHVIHLAGAGIADARWTPSRKKELLSSRVLGTRLLAQTIAQLDNKPKSCVAASAVGYYGDVQNRLCTEDDAPGDDFLAEICIAWEKESQQLKELLPLSIVRIGIVLTLEGGALPKMSLPIRFFAGSVLGRGTQFMSWIHIDDLCRLFLHLLDHPELAGIYNGVAPIPEQHHTVMRAIGRQLKRPVWMWVPGFVLRLLLGEMSSTVLTGQQVSNDKILQTGFTFQYGNIHSALKNLFQKP
jgi:uncharacterized protein